MSDGSPVTPELDARMLADLREWRARVSADTREARRWSMRLTIDELDMLLRAAAERDALKAALCSEWEAEIPDEVRERAGSTTLGIPYSEPMHEPRERPALRDVIADSLGEVGCGSCYESMSTQVEAVAKAIEREIADGGIS